MVRQKYDLLGTDLNEKTRRHWAAAEAMVLGDGGIAIVTTATGLVFNTVKKGVRELEAIRRGEEKPLPVDRIRRPGGGRKKITETNKTLLKDLDALIEPTTRGDPESPLRWTCKSTRNLASTLMKKGHRVSHETVASLLRADGYSLKANRKMAEGRQHPDRNGQFHYISNMAIAFQEDNQPVISVDAKNRELIGNYASKGKEWEPKGGATEVNTHDFPDKELGKVSPYGIYDLQQNEGWISVGIDSNTAQFAVNSIRSWWKKMGKKRYPKARKLLITADAGSSNGYRIRLWKVEVQTLVNELGFPISVCHFPPGTSKWNKIEHRMFSYISRNWRGRPLLNRAMVVDLISSTTTKAGLQIKATLDERQYKTGIKISDKEMKTLNIERDEFHGEWNYTIHPQRDS
jgi:hypothetical protein